jgi:hypothetical protein
MLTSQIEKRINELLTVSCIDEVDTHVIQGIDSYMRNWEPSDFPRLVIFVDDVSGEEQQISPNAPQNRTYGVFIMAMFFGPDYEQMLIQRDAIVDRIIATLKSNKRLGRLADNNTNESVWNSYTRRIRYSRSGTTSSYDAAVLIELVVQTAEI